MDDAAVSITPRSSVICRHGANGVRGCAGQKGAAGHPLRDATGARIAAATGEQDTTARKVRWGRE